MAIAFLARGWGSVFTTGLTIASIVYGPMLGVFLLGAVLDARHRTRRASPGVGASLVAMIAMRLATPLAWTWYVLVGAAICVAVGWCERRWRRARPHGPRRQRRAYAGGALDRAPLDQRSRGARCRPPAIDRPR